MGTGHRGRAGGLAARVLVALYGDVCALGLVVIASVYIGFAFADGCGTVLAIESVWGAYHSIRLEICRHVAMRTLLGASAARRLAPYIYKERKPSDGWSSAPLRPGSGHRSFLAPGGATSTAEPAPCMCDRRSAQAHKDAAHSAPRRFEHRMDYVPRPPARG